MKKIKVLVIPSDKFGCGYYRSLSPHMKLSELYEDDFDVDIKYNINFFDIENLVKYDIIHFHKGLFNNINEIREILSECQKQGVVVIMDIDDYWDVGPFHPSYETSKRLNIEEIIKENLKNVSYVTTTTQEFAYEIEKYNPNVKVIPNAIDREEEQFISNPNPSKRLRFGFVMGSSHFHDMEMLKGLTNKLSKETLSKIQFVLCGFDTRGNVEIIDNDGKSHVRPIHPKESVWYEYERIITDDYRIVSPQYKEWLNRFTPNAKYPFEEEEPYKRRWTKGIMSYCTHYNDIDILLVPLDSNVFNLYKSELKLIEAGMLNKAIIVSDYGPYKIGTESFIDKNSKIVPNGNCILIDNSKSDEEWAIAIELLVNNPEYVETLRKNLHNSIKDKYDLTNVTHERAAWYKKIVKRG